MIPVPSDQNDAILSPRQLGAYLARLGMDRPAVLDFGSLSRLHRAHLLSFTWEGIDAFMGWPSSTSPAAAFAKMVEGRRGGWCYEMNGLFGAALSALGFDVTRLCGCVDRPKLGDAAIGNHLTLRVDIDRPYLAEVGAGDTLFEPVPMAAGAMRQRGFDFLITPTEDGWLRLHNHAQGVARTIDFRPDHSDEAAMNAVHGWLMQDPGSPFTGALAVIRHNAEGYSRLHNDWLHSVSANGTSATRITSADHLAEVFETLFCLDVPELDRVWERVREVSREAAA